jgi:hypothetical protein
MAHGSDPSNSSYLSGLRCPASLERKRCNAAHDGDALDCVAHASPPLHMFSSPLTRGAARAGDERVGRIQSGTPRQARLASSFETGLFIDLRVHNPKVSRSNSLSTKTRKWLRSYGWHA